MASGGPGSPASWNRYAYVHGDPVNFKDPKGLLEASGDTNCTVDGNCNSGGGCIDVICIDFGGDDGGDPGPGPAPARPKRPIDVVTDGLARGELSTRLKNFSSTNCNKVFDRVIGGHSLALAGIAGYTEFYNTTNPVFSTDTQNQVSGNGSNTTLAGSLSTYGASATTINGNLGPAVLLGGDFFANTNVTYQSNVLLHEMLHAYTNWSDNQLFSAFSSYGLQKTQFGGSEDISAWLSTDCTKTPTSLTWWTK